VYGNYDGTIYSPHLYLLVIAPPASGKGKMNLSLNFVEKIHDKIKQDSQVRIDEYSKKKNQPEKIPELDVKLVPGNLSSSRIYSHLANSNHGLIILESEADTISNMLKQEWGNFSDVLRKVFHHEKISISRETDNRFVEINSPRLALILSGTKNQIQPLIQSHENGLFSRFMYYYFEEGTKWRNITPSGGSKGHSSLFKESGESIFQMYGNLASLDCPIEFHLTGTQWEQLNTLMKKANDDIFMETGNYEFLSSVKRHAVMLYRIAMTLSTIRLHETVHISNTLTCGDIDFEIALNIIKTLLEHALYVSELFQKEALGLSIHELSVIAALPKEFKRKEAIKIGTKLQIPERTMDYNLNKWVKKNVLKKKKPGEYKKLIG